MKMAPACRRRGSQRCGSSTDSSRCSGAMRFAIAHLLPGRAPRSTRRARSATQHDIAARHVLQLPPDALLDHFDELRIAAGWPAPSRHARPGRTGPSPPSPLVRPSHTTRISTDRPPCRYPPGRTPGVSQRRRRRCRGRRSCRPSGWWPFHMPAPPRPVRRPLRSPDPPRTRGRGEHQIVALPARRRSHHHDFRHACDFAGWRSSAPTTVRRLAARHVDSDPVQWRHLLSETGPVGIGVAQDCATWRSW